MHQTFYIDVDEEVNSVINRLRKSTSQYNVLAVAQQALILQSSVSLRLIKKEMDMLKKKVMIITQDEHGLAMARKVGFPVKKTIDEIKKPQSSAIPQATISPQIDNGESTISDNKNEISQDERDRLSNLGDSGYIAVDEEAIKIPLKKEKAKKEAKIIADSNLREAVTGGEFDNLFVEEVNRADVDKKNKVVITGARKFLWIFSVVSIILLVGVFAYLFFPKAQIEITPSQSQKNVNLTIKAQETIDDKNSPVDVIELQSYLIEEEGTLSLSFESSGQKTSNNKKARGVIKIYNNFSEASQVLVATTRFLSEDEKLFRLTKTITVPGMKMEDGEVIPGEIEAEIIADQPGEEYNIDSTTFKIPGFEGGPKYEKFVAKSGKKMKGGGEGELSLKTVSQSDIDAAKKETLEKIKPQLNQKIREKIGDDNLFLEEAIEYEILDSASFPEIDSVADSFEYQIKVGAKYLTFSTTELDKKIDDYMDKNILQQDIFMKIVAADKKYEKTESNFVDKSIEIKLVISTLLEAEVDIENIGQELLGKNQEEVDEFIKKHPEIKKINAIISPNFLASKVPNYSSRVEVILINDK